MPAEAVNFTSETASSGFLVTVVVVVKTAENMQGNTFV
jgi:hypothetical protein